MKGSPTYSVQNNRVLRKTSLVLRTTNMPGATPPVRFRGSKATLLVRLVAHGHWHTNEGNPWQDYGVLYKKVPVESMLNQKSLPWLGLRNTYGVYSSSTSRAR